MRNKNKRALIIGRLGDRPTYSSSLDRNSETKTGKMTSPGNIFLVAFNKCETITPVATDM